MVAHGRRRWVVPRFPRSNRPTRRPADGVTVDGMTTTLITGGNKSLGHETARRLKELGHRVVIGARDPERGRRAADELGVEWVRLDVTSDESVAAAAAEVRDRFGGLDVLVNNAGISGGLLVDELDGPGFLAVLDTNTVGPVRTTHAFLPLLRESAAPVIVNVTSGLGSFAVRSDRSRLESGLATLSYSASKAALDMLTLIYAQFVPDVRINVVDPGYTATDFNRHSGPQTVTEGTDAIVAMATIGADGPTGTFTDRHGAVGW
jgi:NAD(P)-dependent dehydrogenase (short-subunit alcohol dehydrogenase family)